MELATHTRSSAKPGVEREKGILVDCVIISGKRTCVATCQEEQRHIASGCGRCAQADDVADDHAPRWCADMKETFSGVIYVGCVKEA